MAHMIIHDFLYVPQICQASFIVHLSLLSNLFNLLLLSVLNFSHLRGLLFEKRLGFALKILHLFGYALFALEVSIEPLFFSLHLPQQLLGGADVWQRA